MKNLYKLLFAAFSFTLFTGLVSCNKETPTTQTDVMNNMLTNKNWYLDYSITGTNTKSYVGQSTYFVTYLKDGTTKDSDGLTGTYTVKVVGNQSQLYVQLKTAGGNPLDVVYNIISVGETKLVLSKVVTTGTATQLYFTNK
jgi:hypothetical protein